MDVLVLGGGPDSERQVSLWSSQGVADALKGLGTYRVRYEVIGRLTQAELSGLPGDVIFPVLHGGWGEGGGLQDLLERDGRAYVGCRPQAARLAMDKLATKAAAWRVDVRTQEAAVFNAADEGCPFEAPVVVKPVHEGSSVGVHFVRSPGEWAGVRERVMSEQREHPGRVHMIERAVLGGRELTVGMLDGKVLAPIEIIPKVAFYDFEAKYTSDDTKYVVEPELPAGVKQAIQGAAKQMWDALGARHLARVDFLLDKQGTPWLLEVNTMPGFTGHSLMPMAAKHAGLSYADLAAKLVELAVRDHQHPAARKAAV
ncbi:MAG TPA: D-alanine--D-alanine ligase [Phycisphaerales bacterium]|nr:D-alanine--D-alanine ligase [Phycisphaerales bacterium]